MRAQRFLLSREFFTVVGFCFFIALAVGSGESADEQKSRMMADYQLSESDYSSGISQLGSPSNLEDALKFAREKNLSRDTVIADSRKFENFEDYKTAYDKHMNPSQYAAYKQQIGACRQDWSKCLDNDQLVNNYHDWVAVQAACKVEADGRAKYDTEWPWLAFSSYRKGKDYPTTGIAIAVEPDAKFQNGFGAKMRMRVTCTYDLRAKRVLDVDIFER